jgi:hypothetical protein
MRSSVGVERVKHELQNLVENTVSPWRSLERKESKSGWLELRLTDGKWGQPRSRAEWGAMARNRNGVERGGKKLLHLDAVV